MKTYLQVTLLAVVASLSNVATVANGQKAKLMVTKLAPGPGPLDNPLKGWCQYPNLETPNQRASMVFHYASWKELEPREGEYAFDAWEAESWNDAPNADQHADKHVVMRVWIDYPKRERGLPDWLAAKGVTEKPYDAHGGGTSPDYDHPAMVEAMGRLITALGKRYNDDPRVAFLQIGMLGHWGEWHTYPRNDLFASLETQRRVIDGFRRAFPNKHLMARTADNYAGELPWIGFHDDLFPDDTDNGEGWSFLAKIRRANRDQNWRVAPIGGEMVPGEATKWMGDEFATTLEMVERSHFTWVGPYNPAHARELSEQQIQNCETLIRRMGYEFRLDRVAHPAEIKSLTAQPIRIAVRGINQGVAPFYYRWPVQIAILDTNNVPVAIAETDWDIRRWQPDEPFVVDSRLTFKPTDADTEIKADDYQLAIGIIDPWKQTPRIGFANELTRTGGWTVLSDIKIAK